MRLRESGIPLLLGAAFASFILGIVFPFFQVTQFWVFDDAVSVLSGILTLFEEQEYFLFAVISLFTVAFPLLKLAMLTALWIERHAGMSRLRRLHRRVALLGKWSMLDVFVVAILIVAMKSAALARIEVSLGLYLFTLSVVLTQAASAWTDHLLNRDEP